MADKVGSSLGGHLYENMQRARKELRHQAHIYANTKDRARRNEAGEALDKAGLALALAAALYGLHSDCARPAGKVGEDWYAALDPETALAKDRAAKKGKR